MNIKIQCMQKILVVFLVCLTVIIFCGLAVAQSAGKKVPDKLIYDRERSDYIAASMNTASMQEALQTVKDLKRINALLIVKDNQLVVEKCFSGTI